MNQVTGDSYHSIYLHAFLDNKGCEKLFRLFAGPDSYFLAWLHLAFLSPMVCLMSVLRCVTQVAVNPPIVLTLAFCGGSHVYGVEDKTAASVKQYEKQ